MKPFIKDINKTMGGTLAANVHDMPSRFRKSRAELKRMTRREKRRVDRLTLLKQIKESD